VAKKVKKWRGGERISDKGGMLILEGTLLETPRNQQCAITNIYFVLQFDEDIC
jgi:hypothetical protein